MQHFFVTPEQVYKEYIVIEGSDVNHIKNVLRMKLGEKLEISDGNNKKYLCAITQLKQEQIQLAIINELEADSELSSNVYLFQGLPKSDKMELIVQKAVELGVYEIIPVVTKRAVVKLDDKKAAKKVERWNSISESGAKQSGRSYVPKVSKVMTFKEALVYAKQQGIDMQLIPYELAEGMVETKRIIDHIQQGQTVGIFIGPEGGFEKEEVELAVQHNVKPITLGRRILRTETAGLAVLSILMFHLENY